jgi:adhesin/invasin
MTRPFYLGAVLLLLVGPTLFLSTCSDEKTTEPVVAASLSAPGGTALVGVVAQPVSVEVLVTGSDGAAFPGGVVSFAVASGGGSVSPAQATSSLSGMASTSWTLGSAAGSQGLSASTDGLSLQFEALARADAPALIEGVTMFVGQYEPGEPLDRNARFVVSDQFGNPVSGQTVSFEASDGGWANPSQAVTDGTGSVSTTWTLGPENGIQSLTATVRTVTPAVLFAEAFDPCLHYQAYAIGQTVSGALDEKSCHFKAERFVGYRDQYSFHLFAQGAFQFDLTSEYREPLLSIGGAGVGGVGLVGVNSNSVTLRAFLDGADAGKEYTLYVTANDSAQGAYTLSSRATPGQMENCEWWTSTWWVSSAQNLQQTDCNELDGDGTALRYFDELHLSVPQGQALRFTMTSQAFFPRIEVLAAWDTGGAPLGAAGDGAQSEVSLDFLAPGAVFDMYVLRFSSYEELEGGPYTFSISSLAGGVGEPPRP